MLANARNRLKPSGQGHCHVCAPGIFKDSSIGKISHYKVDTPGNKPIGSVMTVDFTINGQRFQALNGGPMFKFTEAISIMVECEDQKEIEYYYEKLSAVPEAEQCGWIKDKYGLSWQIIPKNISKLMTVGGEKEKRLQESVMEMKKIDMAALEKIADES